jgi:hypothetical protein
MRHPSPAMTTMPTWLREALIATGHLDNHGNTTTTRRRLCPRCHHPVLTGIDSNGLTSVADPRPLSRTGEAHALLAGRETWDLHYRTLTHRDANTITYRPAGSDPQRPVLAQHHCTQPLPPDTWLPLPPEHANPPTTPSRPQECPW